MFNKSALVALTVALSATAFAASANSQLALSLGVEPGVYTTSELSRLADARENNEKVMERAIINKADATTRGVSFAQPSNDIIVASYAKTVNEDSGNALDVDAFAAHVNGDYAVSAETAAYARAILEDGGVAD